MRTITQRQLRNDSAAVLRDVQTGQRVVVTRNGTPVAQLTPVARQRFVARETIAEYAARAPHIDAATFRADLDRIAHGDIDI